MEPIRCQKAPHGHRQKSYPKGRVCKKEDCETRLSIYNKGKYCNVHDATKPRLRGRPTV